MSKKILGGQIRELINAVGGAVAAFGFINQEIATATGGVLLSVLMLIWGIRDKEGFQVLASLVRKLIASGAAAALVLGWLDKEKFEALDFISAAVLPVVLGFSAHSNGVKIIKGLPVVLFFAFLALAMPSCGASIEYDLGPSFGGAIIGIEIPGEK
jgi:hypothetical protein|tara:strand:- start:1289 stop:1756 length:468 start_codon:yes stop_codon:yes gene_type:complete